MAGMVSFPGLCRRVVRHWRGIVTLLILARAAFYVIYPDEFGCFFDLIFLALFVFFIAGQIFWIRRIIDGAVHFIPSHIGRTRLAVVAALIYLFVYAYSYPSIQSTNDHIFRTNYDRPLTVVTEALFWWWFVGSMLAFFLVLVFGAGDYAARAVTWMYSKYERRHASMQMRRHQLQLRTIAAASCGRARSWSARRRSWLRDMGSFMVARMW